MRRYALLSVNDVREIERIAKALKLSGLSLIATDVPLKKLKTSGIDAISVAEFTGVGASYPFPPTLHPKNELCLTQETEERIELVYDIPYGLDVGLDVGGHTLLALALKGQRIPVCSHEDMLELTDALERSGGVFPEDLVRSCSNHARTRIAKHSLDLLGDSGPTWAFLASETCQLANGENPYQQPAFLMKSNDDPLGLPRFERLGRTPPCFTNLADLDCLVETLWKLAAACRLNFGKEPFVAIAAKHGNPCGISIDWNDRSKAVKAALWGNPLAVWGGEFICNFEISSEIALALSESCERMTMLGSPKWMLDVIAAPAYSNEAIEALVSRKGTKVLRNAALAASSPPVDKIHFRQVRGGLLKEPSPGHVISFKDIEWTGGAPARAELESIIVAWATAFTSSHGGNEVAIAKDGTLMGCGGGPSTVEAAEIAVMRAARGGDVKGASFTADAFFPFTDAPSTLIEAGCASGVAPSGGVRRNEVKSFFKARNVAAGFMPDDIRGFCRH